jgi:hypothetical protein
VLCDKLVDLLILHLEVVLLLLQLDQGSGKLVACGIEIVLDGFPFFPFLQDHRTALGALLRLGTLELLLQVLVLETELLDQISEVLLLVLALTRKIGLLFCTRKQLGVGSLEGSHAAGVRLVCVAAALDNVAETLELVHVVLQQTAHVVQLVLKLCVAVCEQGVGRVVCGAAAELAQLSVTLLELFLELSFAVAI